MPNFGLGEFFCLNGESIKEGIIATIPLLVIAAFLDVVEDYVPALQDVSRATQRSVLGLLGSVRKPFIAFVVSVVFGGGKKSVTCMCSLLSLIVQQSF